MTPALGISGRIAAFFQTAQITPLLALMALLLGGFAVLVTPREEEPQINVTMANVLIPFPGAAVSDVEQMVAIPAEQVLSQINGVEHVMSMSSPGLAVLTVQFKVGVARTDALVRLYDTVNSNADWLPAGLGVLPPIIKPKGIDDVPIVTLTLFGTAATKGAYDLERVAHSIEADLKRVAGTREVTTIGGPGRAVQVELDPARMASTGVTVSDLRGALLSANLGLPLGELLSGNLAVALESGPFLKDAHEVGELVVGVRSGKPVFLQDVATVVDGALPPARYVWHGTAVVLTLAATLFASWAWGFTLNRVSLFALIFSIGILVDDAIVVVENIHRHQQLFPGRSLMQIIPGAVDEVGGPTILATLTVIAALLPMAFVSGLMGPYMSPIPINASMGMLISLAIAYTVTSWLARLWMKDSPAVPGLAAKLRPLFQRIFRPLLDDRHGRRNRSLLGLGIALLITVSVALPIFGLVLLKMLPFDNKSEFQVIVDMPVGTPVEKTAAVLRELGRHLATVPEVIDYQAYAGTAAPINFNGLVRQYYLRTGGAVGDLQVNLIEKHQRTAQSHAIATRVRPALQRTGARFGANVKVVEVPPGPPVLAPIVAEVYGPDAEGRRQVAKAVRAMFSAQAGVVDADDSKPPGGGSVAEYFIHQPGIIVRNSILLVDFINLQVREGMDFKEAVVHSAITRAQPIMLTGLAAMFGAFFILDDPIFNGLPISLIFGILVSTVLTLVVIPLLYFMAYRNRLGALAAPDHSPDAPASITHLGATP
jgi:multidrug efflux pump subunit AcrB